MDREKARAVLNKSQSIAIVGVSDKADRPSYGVAKYLLEKSDYTIYLVNPNFTDIFGQRVYASLSEVSEARVQIDIVDVFRRVEDMPQILDEAIALGAKTFWMQLGLRDEVLRERGEAAGLEVIQDLCIKIEHENFTPIEN